MQVGSQHGKQQADVPYPASILEIAEVSHRSTTYTSKSDICQLLVPAQTGSNGKQLAEIEGELTLFIPFLCWALQFRNQDM
jgi:hypothetical protein